MNAPADFGSPSYVRVLTAPGRAAVGVVEMRVPLDAAAQVFDACFRTKILEQVAAAPLNRILFGQWNGEDVVVVRTAVDRWEIQCHGGPVPIRAITESISAILPQIDGADGLIGHVFDDQPRLESMLLESLIRTQTVRTASSVLAQLSGVLRQHLELLTSLPTGDERLVSGLQELQGWSRFAAHLTEAWRILILGPPNAGKSSLVNAILGFERTIVSDEAGTTRDLIEATTVLQGWPFLICDSAGLRRHTKDPLEQAGMASVQTQAMACDLILVVLEVTDTDDPLASLLPKLPMNVPRLILLNKLDCVSQEDLHRSMSSVRRMDPRSQVIGTSAIRGDGVSAAMDAVVSMVIPEVPSKSTPLPACEPLRELLMALDLETKNPQHVHRVLEAIRELL